MPKLKTHSGAKKRFNLTKNGKVKRYSIFLYAGAFMRRHSVIAVVRQIMNISPYIAANE